MLALATKIEALSKAAMAANAKSDAAAAAAAAKPVLGRGARRAAGGKGGGAGKAAAAAAGAGAAVAAGPADPEVAYRDALRPHQFSFIEDLQARHLHCELAKKEARAVRQQHLNERQAFWL